jgi:hypothetical protein
VELQGLHLVADFGGLEHRYGGFLERHVGAAIEAVLNVSTV